MSAPKAGATPSDQARKDASASAHQSKADWEAVQKKSFARWCNTYLSARSEKIEDLGTDFKDGLRLIHLVEELSGVPLGRHNKAPKLDMQRMENIDLALKFLTKHERVTLVNIGAEGAVTCLQPSRCSFRRCAAQISTAQISRSFWGTCANTSTPCALSS